MDMQRDSRRFLYLLLTVQGVLLVFICWNTAPGWDEWGHLPSGLYSLQFGSYAPYCVNPPLVRLWAALPVWLAGGGVAEVPISVSPGVRPEWPLSTTYVQQHGERAFFWMSVARTAVIPVSLLGTWLIWEIGRHLYGKAPACVASSLWVFSPTVLTFGATIAPDVSAAVFGLFAAWRCYVWLRLGTARSAILLGVATALAMLSKATWLLLPPGLTCIVLLYGVRKRATWSWRVRLKQTAIAVSVAWLLIHGCYEFQGVMRPLGEFEFVSRSLAGDPGEASPLARSGNRFRDTWLDRVPAPLPADYVRGIDQQKRDFERRMDSYFLGQWRDHGWLHYYVIGIFLKEPVAIWGICALGILWGLKKNPRPCSAARRTGRFVVLAPGFVVLIFVSWQTGFNHHLRYVLPFFPCLYLMVAGPLTRLSRPMAAVVAGLCLWYAASVLTVVPRTYAYFTEAIGGPANGWKYMGNSNLDWGQDLLTAKRWIESNPEKRPVYLVYDPRTEYEALGIDATDGRELVTSRGPTEPGWWIVSACTMLRPDNQWFRAHPPTERLSVTTTVYYISDDLQNRE